MALSREDHDAYEMGQKERAKGIGAIFDWGNTLTDMFIHDKAQQIYYEQGLNGKSLNEVAKEKEPELPPSREEPEPREEPESSSDDSDSGGSSYNDFYPSSSTYTPPASKPDEPVPGIVWIFGIILVVVVLVSAFRDTNHSPTPSGYTPANEEAYNPSGSGTPAQPITAPPTTMPPAQIIEVGRCPYECCVYNEHWLAKEDVDLYAAPPETVGADVSSLEKQLTVSKGDWVTTKTGRILARRHLGKVGDRIVSLYAYLSEGCWRTWIDGQLGIDCHATSLENAQQEWWIQVEASNGLLAWVKEGPNFVSQKTLNSLLGDKIADPKLALPDKLAEVDSLIQGGADINGDGGKYGNVPLLAAISANDVELLKELMVRGIDLKNSKLCPAYTSAGHALQPGGDIMLEFLLNNGMQLNCLTNATLDEFLRFGIATDSYPVDRAVKVAEVLVQHGASFEQKNFAGQTIFEMLDDPNLASHPHVAELKEALMKLKNQSHPAPTWDNPPVSESTASPQPGP